MSTDINDQVHDGDADKITWAAPKPVEAPTKQGFLARIFSHPLCCIGYHRYKLASAGSTIVPGNAWSGGLIDVCRDCGRMLNHDTKELLTSPHALAAGQLLKDRSPFARLRCLVEPHDFKGSSAIFPKVSHWEECTRCDLRRNER